jgi:hypothetical protein
MLPRTKLRRRHSIAEYVAMNACGRPDAVRRARGTGYPSRCQPMGPSGISFRSGMARVEEAASIRPRLGVVATPRQAGIEPLRA